MVTERGSDAPRSRVLDDDRRRWRLRWLGCIQELSDRALQRATWLNEACTNPHYAHAEFLNCYLYDRMTASGMYGYADLVLDGYVSAVEDGRGVCVPSPS